MLLIAYISLGYLLIKLHAALFNPLLEVGGQLNAANMFDPTVSGQTNSWHIAFPGSVLQGEA